MISIKIIKLRKFKLWLFPYSVPPKKVLMTTFHNVKFKI